MNLNQRAWWRCDELANDAERLGVAVSTLPAGTRLIDCGVKAAGGRESGRLLAEICLADLGWVGFTQGQIGEWFGTLVSVQTEQPVLACMASQYAGWQITGEKFFAMGSGPMRAAYAHEAIFQDIGYRETSDCAVGVLETSKLPPESVCVDIAKRCGVASDRLTLLVARTASQVGTVQIVARSVETALHKLHALGYDLKKVISGIGTAPLPPVAADDTAAIGRTNDAMLYGADVTLQVRDDDAALAEIGPQIPSSGSRDYGEPFAAIFERYDRDFYKIDPLLFSPAAVTLVNVATGKQHRFGELRPDILTKSWGG